MFLTLPYLTLPYLTLPSVWAVFRPPAAEVILNLGYNKTFVNEFKFAGNGRDGKEKRPAVGCIYH